MKKPRKKKIVLSGEILHTQEIEIRDSKNRVRRVFIIRGDGAVFYREFTPSGLDLHGDRNKLLLPSLPSNGKKKKKKSKP